MWRASGATVRLAHGLALALVALSASACGRSAAEPHVDKADRVTDGVATVGGRGFEDVTRTAGLEFEHRGGRSGDDHMFEIFGSGAALLDIELDGDLDLFVVQSIGRSVLYRNLASERAHDGQSTRLAFELVPDAIPELPGYGIGVASGDFDGDGDPDLYVTAVGQNTLLGNDGGVFRDVTTSSGTGESGFSVPASFFDYDGDGWLDLFVGNYVTYPETNPPRCQSRTGALDYCGPGSFRYQPDRLFRNRGDGSFEDVSETTGIGALEGPVLGALAADFDLDGWLDLYVAHDAEPNVLWRNIEIEGIGRGFLNVALLSGAALNYAGEAEGSMGVDAADLDLDGDLDLVMTHLDRESNTYYRNDGEMGFEDATETLGLAAGSRNVTSFGSVWLDFDLDGDLDLFTASGAIAKLPALERAGDPFPLHQPNQWFRNTGDDSGRAPRFELVEPDASWDAKLLERSRVSRGVAAGDLDNDGAIDLVVTNNHGPLEVLRNRVKSEQWLGVELRERSPAGVASAAHGAMATLLSAEEPLGWRRVRIDGSYASAGDPRISFAVPGGKAPTGLRVRWADGSVEDFEAPPMGVYSVVERSSERAGAR